MTAHIIWIIVGQCGEYSDRCEWNVCWRHTEADAMAVVAVMNREAAAEKITYDENDYNFAAQEERSKAMADPFYRNDYTGTKYHCEAVADDARAFEAEKGGAAMKSLAWIKADERARPTSIQQQAAEFASAMASAWAMGAPVATVYRLWDLEAADLAIVVLVTVSREYGGLPLPVERWAEVHARLMTREVQP